MDIKVKLIIIVFLLLGFQQVSSYPYEDEIKTSFLELLSNTTQQLGDVQLINENYIKRMTYLNYSLNYLNSYPQLLSFQLEPPEAIVGSINDMYTLNVQLIFDYFNFENDGPFQIFPNRADTVRRSDETRRAVIYTDSNGVSYYTSALVINSVSDKYLAARETNVVFLDLDSTSPENLLKNITIEKPPSSFDFAAHLAINGWAKHLYRVSGVSEQAIKQTYNKTIDRLTYENKLVLTAVTHSHFAAMQAPTASIVVKSYFSYLDMIEEQLIEGLEIEDISDPVTQNVLILNQKVLDLQNDFRNLPVFGTIKTGDINIPDNEQQLLQKVFTQLAIGASDYTIYDRWWRTHQRCFLDGGPNEGICQNIKSTFYFPDYEEHYINIHHDEGFVDVWLHLSPTIRVILNFKILTETTGNTPYFEMNFRSHLTYTLTLMQLKNNKFPRVSYRFNVVGAKIFIDDAVSLPFNIAPETKLTFKFENEGRYLIVESNTFEVFEEIDSAGIKRFGFTAKDFNIYDWKNLELSVEQVYDFNWDYYSEAVRKCCDTITTPSCRPLMQCFNFVDYNMTRKIGFSQNKLEYTSGCYKELVDTVACPTSLIGLPLGAFKVKHEFIKTSMSIYGDVHYLINGINTPIVTYNDFEGYIITALNNLATMTLSRLDDLENRVGNMETFVKNQQATAGSFVLDLFLSFTGVGLALSDLSRSMKSASKLSELKLGRRAANAGSLADNFIEPLKKKNIYMAAQSYDPVKAMYDGSIYNYAHLYSKTGFRSETVQKLKSIDDLTWEKLLQREVALDIREIMQLNNADFLAVQQIIQKGLPQIDSYLAPFGSVQALKSPIAELGLFGRKIADVKILSKGEKSFISNSYQRYPYHTSTVSTVADFDENGDIIVNVRFAGVGEPSIIGPTNVKNPKVKLGYIKTQYKFDKEKNKLNLVPWNEVKINNKQMYEKNDIDELYRSFYGEGFGWTPSVPLSTEQKWEAIVLSLNARIRSRDVIDSVPLPNSIFHEMVDGLVYFSSGGNSFSYNLLNNNCQTFVKTFSQIISGQQIKLNLRSSDFKYIAEYYSSSAQSYFENSQYMLQHSFARTYSLSNMEKFIESINLNKTCEIKCQ